MVASARGGSPAPEDEMQSCDRWVRGTTGWLRMSTAIFTAPAITLLWMRHIPTARPPGVSTSTSPTGLPSGVISWRFVLRVCLYRAAVNAVLPVHLGPLSTNVVASTPDTVPFEVKRPDSFSFSPTLPL